MMDRKDTLFIIGSGLSLNEIDITKLKDCNTMSMNRQYIAYPDWSFIPTYYLIIDPLLIPTIYKDIEGLVNEEKDIKKFFIMKNDSVSEWMGKLKQEHGDRIVQLDIGGDEKLVPPHGTLENRKMGFVGNAGACAVEVALYLGYKKIVLLGIDAHYVDREESIKSGKDLSHFHPNYFDVKTFVQGVNQGPHRNDGDSGVKYWRLFSEQQKNIPNFEIVSSSPNSPINNFLEYVDFEEFFKTEENEESSNNTGVTK